MLKIGDGLKFELQNSAPSLAQGNLWAETGKLYYRDGTTTYNLLGAVASPDKAVQFNNSGAFGGSSNFLWDNTKQQLYIKGSNTEWAFLVETGTSAAVGNGIKVFRTTDSASTDRVFQAGTASRELSFAPRCSGSNWNTNTETDDSCLFMLPGNVLSIFIKDSGTGLKVRGSGIGVWGLLELKTASSASTASFRIPHGSAPLSPVDGDIWTTSSGVFARVSGTTVTLGSPGGGGSPGGSNTQVQYNNSGSFGGSSGLTLNATNVTGFSMSGAKATFAATAAGYASINLPHGTAPSAPSDGDVWTTTAGMYARINGSTVGPLGTGGGGGTPGGADTQIQYNDSGAFNGSANLTLNKTSWYLTSTSSHATYAAYFKNSSTGGVVSEATSASGYASFNLQDNTSTLKGGFGYGNSATASPYNGAAYFFSSGASTPLRYITNGTLRQTIFAGGNVNIGSSTSDAGYKLNVEGTINASAIITATTNGVPGGQLTLKNSSASGYCSIELQDSGGTSRAGFGYGNASVGAPLTDRAYFYLTGKNFLITDGTNIPFFVDRANNRCGIAGITSPTAALHLPAATTAITPLRIPHGTAPTTPQDGDMWTTTAGLYVRINGTTVGPLT